MPDGHGDGPRRVVDHFAVLGLTPEASDTEVRRAYRGRARDPHPDRGGDAEEFARVSAAYEALRGPGARERVALELRVQARRDEMAGGRPTTSVPPRTAGPPGPPRRTTPPGPPGPARPAPPPGTSRPGPSRPGPGGPRRPASRLSQAEQDRLIDEFLRSHPEATRGSRTSAPGPAGGGGGRADGGRTGARSAGRRQPRRRPRRVRRALLAVLAVAGLVVVSQPLLPETVQEAVSGWVQVVSP